MRGCNSRTPRNTTHEDHNTDTHNTQRLRLLQRFEQLSAALADNAPRAENEARIILARVVARGSCPLLAQVFRGIIMAWDKEHESEWRDTAP